MGLADSTKDPGFEIGKRSSAFLSVEVRGRCHPEADDFWDGNWVDGRVELAVGGFRAAYSCTLRSTDFSQFRAELSDLYGSLAGRASFETMEGQLQIVASGEGNGHFEARCRAMDEAGVGSRLTFILEFDQSEIPAILRGLDSIIAAYPTKADDQAK